MCGFRCITYTCRGQWVSSPLEWKLQVIVSPQILVLGIESGSSARVVSSK